MQLIIVNSLIMLTNFMPTFNSFPFSPYFTQGNRISSSSAALRESSLAGILTVDSATCGLPEVSATPVYTAFCLVVVNAVSQMSF